MGDQPLLSPNLPFDEQVDRLSLLMVKQLDLMKAVGSDPTRWDVMRRTKETCIISLALMVETVEMLQELNWKPWKKTQHPVKMEKVKEELVDCLHFLLELMIIWGMTPKEVFGAYQIKHGINKERIKNGY